MVLSLLSPEGTVLICLMIWDFLNGLGEEGVAFRVDIFKIIFFDRVNRPTP